jgi:hypothetical protein
MTATLRDYRLTVAAAAFGVEAQHKRASPQIGGTSSPLGVGGGHACATFGSACSESSKTRRRITLAC